MKVLHLAGGTSGAADRQLAGLVRSAHGDAWNATLCVLRAGSALATELAPHLPVLEFGARSAAERLRMVRRLVRLGAYDVVHVALPGGDVPARVASAFPSRPAVVVSERRVRDVRAAALRAVGRLRPPADHFVTDREQVAASVRRAYGVGPDRVSVVPDGGTVRRTPARIGVLGPLVPRTCTDMAIAALDALLDAGPGPAELVIAGNGPERARLGALARGLPVTFAGDPGSPAEVAAFLSGLDVLVLPSRYESLPGVVAEARARGVPVVAHDLPGMARPAGDGVTLVPADDPPGLARALLAVVAPARSFSEVAAGHLVAFERALTRLGRPRVLTVSGRC